MAEIDYNQIYDGVTLALHRAFPDSMIHGGTVKQDLHPGDYNVLPVATSHTAQIGARAQRKAVFDVIYYPSNTGGRAECLQRAHSLAGILGTIQTPNGDKLHCLSFENTVEDDVLHCVVGYPHFVRRVSPPESSMESLHVE